jgi:hypothetical protein
MTQPQARPVQMRCLPGFDGDLSWMHLWAVKGGLS